MNKKINYFYLVIIILFVFILLFFYNFIEGFTNSSTSSSSSTSSGSSSSSVDYYDNLSRLPSNNVWSSSTIQQLLDYFNSKNSKNANYEPLTEDSPGFKTYLNQFQPYATDSEVVYLIKNGQWEWNGYVSDYLTTLMSSSNFNPIPLLKEFFPNRLVYINLIAPNTVPQEYIITQLKSGKGLTYPNNTLNCVNLNKGEQKQPDGNSSITIDTSGSYLLLGNTTNGVYTLDNNAWSENIPGFTFNSDPCNLCQITTYSDPSNNCLFTINTPEAYEKYMGNNSVISSNSSNSTSIASYIANFFSEL
jgi:hypothetical protein